MWSRPGALERGGHPLRRVSALVLCAFAVCTWSTAAVEQPSGSPAAIRSLIDGGRYEEAEASAASLVASTKDRPGVDEVEVAAASDLLVEALLKNGKGAKATTRALAESVLRIRTAQLQRNDTSLCPSLVNLANVLAAAGEPRQSLPLFERAIKVLEGAGALQELAKASALDDQARAQIQATRYEDAKHSLERALTIKEANLDRSDSRIASTLEQLALALQRSGEYRPARQLLERALKIRDAGALTDPGVITTLNLLGDQLWFEGESPEAQEPFYRRALAIAESVLRSEHPLTARVLKNLATPAFDLGNLTEARSLQERALAIAESAYGPSHPEVAGLLNDLAITHRSQGDYTGARTLYERAVRVIEGRPERDELRLATLSFNLAQTDLRLGDFDEARRQLIKARQIWQRVSGPDHPYVARAVAAIAEVFFAEGRYAEAQTFQEQALRIRQRRVGAKHPDVAQDFANLAKTLEAEGQLDRAQQLSARALDILEEFGAHDTPTFVQVLDSHAHLLTRRGDFRTASEFYERALTIRKRLVGPSHPDYAATQVGLAVALAGLGSTPEAVEAALQAEETGRKHLETTLRYLPERQSLNYAATRPRGLDLAISVSASNSDAIPRVFDALIRSRALVLDEMAARHRLRTEGSGALAPLWSSLTSARQRLANLVVRGPSDQRPEQYARLVEGARKEKEAAETALAEKSASFRSELSREEIGLDAVRRGLPLGTALVAFIRYDRTTISDVATTTGTAVKRLQTIPSYMAFVAHSDRADISMVPLGGAASLDALVARWHAEATGIVRSESFAAAETAYRTVGTELRRRIWDPISVQLKDAINVFVVPDGALNVVTLAALPTGRTTYLIDNGPVIHYLSAERDLVTSPTQSTAGRGLLALGGAAFDDPTLFSGTRRVTRTAAPEPALRTRGACGDLPSLHFDPLEATGREAQDVARLWAGSPVELLQAGAANERAFKQSAPGRSVLHLATHGFFLGSDCAPGVVGTRGVGGLGTTSSRRANAGTADNPLLLSGLGLAGANQRAAAGPKDEDGILTAEEVASLNLDGVEWAVLSACETGLGVVRAGEGVFGLRRAFQVAGVHTVIMSLWQVEDESARAWMRALYEGRLKKKLNTAQAVQQASLTVLRDRRAAGQSTHPFYWAGFAAAGDWR